MAGVAENLNVHATLKNQRLKWHVGGNDFLIEQLSSKYCVTIKRLFHSAVGTLF